MRTRQIESRDGRRTLAIVFGSGDEAAQGLVASAQEHGVSGAYFTGIGAFREVTLGYWESETKDYRRIPVREQVEVLSLTGNVALSPDGAPRVHAHVVIGKADGTAHGGHLLEGYVRPTLEVILVESPHHLQRTHDPETGLALIDVGA
ncbi:MAG: PPC domain-containing DNA-binding protein [Gemmatimonadaceae bacterium]